MASNFKDTVMDIAALATAIASILGSIVAIIGIFRHTHTKGK